MSEPILPNYAAFSMLTTESVQSAVQSAQESAGLDDPADVIRLGLRQAATEVFDLADFSPADNELNLILAHPDNIPEDLQVEPPQPPRVTLLDEFIPTSWAGTLRFVYAPSVDVRRAADAADLCGIDTRPRFAYAASLLMAQRESDQPGYLREVLDQHNAQDAQTLIQYGTLAYRP